MKLDEALAPRPRVSYQGNTVIINRIATEALKSRYVSMTMEGGEVVLRARHSLPREGGDLICGTLTPIGQGRVFLRIGQLMKRYSLPRRENFSVLPQVAEGEVRFLWGGS